MTTGVPTTDPSKGTAALAAVPSADERSHLPKFGHFEIDDEPDPLDTTTILHGAKAVLGKGAAITILQNADTFARYDAARKKEAERQAAEARELARLAEWGAQRTVIGGVAMTNAEAQDARQRVIDNGDRYAEWAVRQGYIRVDQKAEFIETMRLQKELEDKRGRGTITLEEERRADAIKRSQMGQGLDAAAGYAHQERGVSFDARTGRAASSEDLANRNGAPPTVDRRVFQDYAATTVPPPVVKTAPLSDKVMATGLNL